MGLCKHVTFKWIASHKGLEGNEAEKMAQNVNAQQPMFQFIQQKQF